MKKTILFVLVLAVVMLTGCSARQARVRDASLVTKHVSANVAVKDAFANLQQGFRYCSQAHYGYLQCGPVEKNGAVSCNVFSSDPASAKPPVLGKIELAPESSGTKAIFRITTAAEKRDDILTGWEIFMSGRAREACP